MSSLEELSVLEGPLGFPPITTPWYVVGALDGVGANVEGATDGAVGAAVGAIVGAAVGARVRVGETVGAL